MTQVFTITGIIVWTAMVLASLYFLIYMLYKFTKQELIPTVHNIMTAIFGAKWFREKSDEELIKIYMEWYAHRSGVRAHWKSWKNFRRPAYARMILAVKAAIERNITNK